MINIKNQTFYEKYTGNKHEVSINFEYVYKVYLDGEFYATAEHKLQAYEEVIDIIKTNNWSPINPL